MRTIRFILGAICLSIVLPLTSARAASSPTGLHLVPCTQGSSKVAAECGTFGVYEDRDARAGRTISLNVIVVKATHPTHRAIAFIAGRPGESATSFAPYIADGAFFKAFSSLRDRYDTFCR